MGGVARGNMWARRVIARSGLDREGAVSGLNLGPPSADGSSAVEADVAARRGTRIEIGLGQQVVAERFQ